MAIMRSPLGRVRGRGSAKMGVGHFSLMRMSSMALVPLTLWFLVSVGNVVGADYAGYRAWIGEVGNATMMVLLIATVFHHAAHGLQVVIEDYVPSEEVREVMIVGVKFLAALLAVNAIIAVLKVAIGG